MNSYTRSLGEIFRRNADYEKAAGAKAYMRNQFDFLGIPAPLRRQLGKDYMKKQLPDYKNLPSIVKELWMITEREFQYFAVELVAAYKRSWEIEIVELIEYLITNKSWWDSVDHIASELTGPYFKRFPEQVASVTAQWNRSENIWLQRSSIMFQKSYRQNTDKQLLSQYIHHLCASKEFFVQKAIGWALREFSKTDAEWVKRFVQEHKLPPLSEREALKRMA